MRPGEWKVRSIKHWPDGHWDALVVINEGGRQITKRMVSEDGFQWVTNYNRKVKEEIQNDLTQCVGDMINLGARVVVF